MSVDPDQDVLALRAAVLRLKAPQVSKRAPAPSSSVYGRAAAAVAADVRPPAGRSSLETRFRNVETTALMAGTTMALVVLPDAAVVPVALRDTLELLVKAGASALVLGRDIPRQIDRTHVVTLPLRADDALKDEWALLALGPRKRVAFLARREDDGDSWSWMLTRDPVAVQRAGTAILERAPFLGLRVPPLED